MCLFRIKQGLLEVEVCPYDAGPRVWPVLLVAHAAVAGGVPLREAAGRLVLGYASAPYLAHGLQTAPDVPLPLVADLFGGMLPQ